jgi:hypothetical protein
MKQRVGLTLIWRAFTDALIRRAQRYPYFHLTHEDESPYMQRYWLMPRCLLVEKPRDVYDRHTGQWLGTVPYLDRRFQWLPAIRIHNIQSSDYDRDLHDHPFGSVSWILRGGYVEVTPRHAHQHPACDHIEGGLVYTRRKPGDFAIRRATQRHRLIIEPWTAHTGGCWSLFAMSGKSRGWGFHTKAGFVPHEKYISVHQGTMA